MIEESDRELMDSLYADAGELKRYQAHLERTCDFLVAQALLRVKHRRIGGGSTPIEHDEKLRIAQWFAEKHGIELGAFLEQIRSSITHDLDVNQLRRKRAAEEQLAHERRQREEETRERQKDLL